MKRRILTVISVTVLLSLTLVSLSVGVDNAYADSIEIDEPSTTYYPGGYEDISGSTPAHVDEVFVLVRDRDNYMPLFSERGEPVAVSHGEFEETRVQLSGQDGPGADILSLPGSYSFGVVDAEDVENFAEDEGYASAQDALEREPGLPSAAFNRGASAAQSIRVAEPSLDAEMETYMGQVYREDGLYVSGELIGPREFAVISMDTRGQIMFESATADRTDGSIDERSLDLESLQQNSLQSGTVESLVLSPGVDGLFGNGTFYHSNIGEVDADMNGLEALLFALSEDEATRTPAHTRDAIMSQTVEQPDSDDLAVTDSFRLATESRTEIDDVVLADDQDMSDLHPIEHGETMLVRGTTNRNPDEVTLVLEAEDGPEQGLAAFPVETTENWDFDGVWSVEMDITEDVVEGTYDLQVDDGDTTDIAEVEIVGAGERGDDADDDGVEEHEEPAEFELTDVELSDEAESGSTTDVQATVTNIGGQSGTATVEYRFEGQTVDTRNILLQSGVSTGVSFSYSLPEEAGDYSHGVIVDQDSVFTQLEVEEDETTAEDTADDSEDETGEKDQDSFEDETEGAVGDERDDTDARDSPGRDDTDARDSDTDARDSPERDDEGTRDLPERDLPGFGAVSVFLAFIILAKLKKSVES